MLYSQCSSHALVLEKSWLDPVKELSPIHLASILLTYIRCIFTNVSNLIDIKFSVILVVLFWISWLALATKRSPADSASWRKLGGNRERTDAPVHIGIHNSCFILYIIITCICISIFAVYRVAIPVVTKIMSYAIPQVVTKSSNITSGAVHFNNTTPMSYSLHLGFRKAMTSTIFRMLFTQSF